ncbi:hypothetical protein [Streptomyces scabiei]|uniref:DUF7352 domain-containing protein n=1 Tax=Streptomyces scabiei TaxID=1930 RepID=UPI0029B475E3|nr:hypothetical protein [Streptomyces scabiei]MDX3520714.1 hypothetical protein [Streptomyces scabiei]
MADSVYRYEVPVDDRWHPLQLSGRILHVGCRNPRAVEVWALHTDQPTEIRGFRVYGTGHPLAPGGQLVWHLFESP